MQKSESVGVRLREIRKQKGLTQVELAKRMGVDQSVVSYYEHDRGRMFADVALKFAQALGTSLDEIFGLKRVKIEPEAPPSRALLRRVARIQRLPKRDQQAILRVIDSFLRGQT